MSTIKEAATRAGLTPTVARAWERRYGVVAPARTTSGYRLYDEAAIERYESLPENEDRLFHTLIRSATVIPGTGVAPFVAVLFGVMSGTFGGVIGDIVCNEVPSLFRPSTPLYATMPPAARRRATITVSSSGILSL